MNRWLVLLVLLAAADGRAEAGGFRLAEVKDGSPYAAMGLQNGDVITSINGCALRSPDDAARIYDMLKAATEVVVDLQRGGAAHVLRFDARQGSVTLVPASEFRGARPACQLAPKAEPSDTTKILPAFAGDKMIGLKVLKLGGTDWLANRGVQSGDVVRRVNGCLLAPAERAEQILARARAPEVSVTLEVSRNKQLTILRPAGAATSPLDDVEGDRAECASFLGAAAQSP